MHAGFEHPARISRRVVRRLLCCTLTVAAVAAMGARPARATHRDLAMTKRPLSEEPIACRLDVFGGAERVRHNALTAELRSEVRKLRELRDGYAMRLPADSRWLADAGAWMALERRCCPFFDFQLTWRRGEDSPWLRITGPPGVKAIIASGFVNGRR